MNNKPKIEPNQPKHPVQDPKPIKPRPSRKIPEKDKPTRPPVEVPDECPTDVPIKNPTPDTINTPKAGV